MEFVLLWMCVGMLAAFVARSRGRAGAKWFLLSLVLGPLGFVAAFWPGKK